MVRLHPKWSTLLSDDEQLYCSRIINFSHADKKGIPRASLFPMRQFLHSSVRSLKLSHSLWDNLT